MAAEELISWRRAAYHCRQSFYLPSHHRVMIDSELKFPDWTGSSELVHPVL
jgi:hypothetical protein